MEKVTKEQLKGWLQSGICEVKFTKVDGSERVMPCTLKEDLLPQAAPRSAENTKVRKVNDANMSVWCTDKGEWRSFKVANVISVTVLS